MRTPLIAALATLFILVSCQKEASFQSGVMPVNIDTTAAIDSNKLAEFVDLDTTQTAGSDTQDVQTYRYDAQRRLAAITYKEYPNAGTLTEVYSFFYHASDSLPYLRILGTNQPGSSPDTSYYTYVGGQLITDSSSSGSFVVVRHYINGTNTITETTSFDPTPHVYHFTKSAGNTVLQADTSSAGAISRFQFAYDNKNNPFFGLPYGASDRRGPYYSMETYPDEMIYEKNNPVEINENQGGPTSFHYILTYQYKTNGYPSVVRATDPADPTDFWKRVYIYTYLP